MTCSSAPVFEWSPRPLHLVAAEHSCYQYLEGERLLDGRVLLVTDGYTVVHCLHCTFQCSLYQEFLSDGSLVPLSHALQNPGFSPIATWKKTHGCAIVERARHPVQQPGWQETTYSSPHS